MKLLYHTHNDFLSLRFQGFWLLIFLGLCCLSAAPSRASSLVHNKDAVPAVIINVHSSAEIIGPNILLQDIAVVQAPQAILNTLNTLKIAKAPGPGLKRLLPGSKISHALRTVKNLHSRPIIKGSDFIQIYRAYQAIPDEYMQQVLYRYLDDQTQGASVKLEHLKIHGKNRFPLGTLKAAVTRHNTDRLLGAVKFVLSVQVDAEQTDLISVSAWINQYAKAVYTNRSLSRGTRITEQDLCLKTLNLSKSPENICMRIQDAIGKQVKQSLRSGVVLRDSVLETPPTIYKGDRVKIVAGRGLLLVSAKGLAKTDGYMNRQIKVQNSNSKRIIIGRVVDHSTVEVSF